MEDTVVFGSLVFNVPTGHSEAEIREALEEQAPAIAHATVVRSTVNGATTWTFSEAAGTKG